MYVGYVVAGIVALVVVIKLYRVAPKYLKNLGNRCTDAIAAKYLIKSDVTDRLLEDQEFLDKLKAKLLAQQFDYKAL